MPEHDLDLLIEAAQAAGRIATSFTGQTAKKWDKPNGAGPVTEADLAVDEMLHKTLLSARPSYGWLSEETEDNDLRLKEDKVFIIDPIDGTRSFAEGANTWAHSLAISNKGEITAAVVFLPLRDKMYTAAKGHGAWLNGEPLTVSTHTQLANARVLATKVNSEPRF